MADETQNKSILRILKSRVSYLRFFVYTFLAISILSTCLISLWIYHSYNTESQYQFETYYSEAPQKRVAYLYLSPQQGNFRVGTEFSVDILINTVGSNVNAVAGHLTYDKEVMEAIAIDISGSMLTIPFEQVINKE